MSKENDLKLAEEYFEEGSELEKTVKYEEAIQRYEQASVLYEKWEVWEKWVKVNNDIGWNFYCLLKYDIAIEWFQQVLEKGKKKLGYKHPNIAGSLNDLGASYIAKGNYDLAIACHQEALAIRKKCLGNEHLQVAASLNNLGVCCYLKGDYNLAISYYQSTLVIRKKKLDEKHPKIAATLNNIGGCYYTRGNNDLAIRFHKEALAIWKKNLSKEDPKIADSLNNLGACYESKRDYSLAIAFHKEALAIRKKKFGENHFFVSRSLNNLGVCYQAKGENDLAIDFYEKTLTIRKKNLDKNHTEIARVLNNIGTCYTSKGEYDSAISFHQEVLAIRKKNLGKNHIDIAYSFNNLGTSYQAKKEYDRAIVFHKKTLAIWIRNWDKNHPHIGGSLNNLGTCYQAKGDNNHAINYYQKALIALVPSFHQEAIFQNPILINYSSGNYLLNALEGKTKTILEIFTQQTEQIKYLQSALSTIHLATDLITDLRQSYKTEGSKHTLAENAAKTYNLAIKIAIKTTKIYQPLPSIPQHLEFANIPYTIEGCKNLAFSFSEQSKAILLLSSLKDFEAKAAANIPKNLLQKEKQLKTELNYLDKSIATQEAKGDQKDEELLSKFQSQHFDYKQQYDQLIEQFEADYPEYYRLKYSVETASVEEVQRYLRPQTPPLPPSKGEFSVLISYHIADEFIYIFSITSNDYQTHSIEKPSNFTQLIVDFQDAIALADIDEYMDSASILFDLLLLPVLEEIQNTSKLILIPHNELTTVSFDALIDTRKLKAESRAKISADCDFSALPYLVKDYDISYHYSATMLLHSVARQEQKPLQAASFVGFAPVNFDGSEKVDLALASNGGQTKVMRSNRAGERALATLPNTENEVKEVFQLFEAKELEAKAFLYASANKENLFENAMKHKYVLIATHGYAQDGNADLSGIYLARGQEAEIEVSDTFKVSDTYNPTQSNNYLLHTSEAYHLQLDAELVVLSSCSSGVGKLVTGEGMMAINRGFLYAGASNIIFTHFDIPDESSGELVKALFEQILKETPQKEGKESYARALRKAKLDLIEQKMKTPEDWAGYALIGG
ncbi:MAG: CHAT domain-containing protein [Chitinophagales bacterium]